MAYSYNSAYDRPAWDRINCPFSRRLQELVTDPAALAKYLGCTVQAVNQYKTNSAFPKTENLIKIAEYYQVSLDYLMGFTSVPNVDTSIQSVNEVTGLSVGAIEKLHDIKESNPAFSEIISLLLDDSNCEYFLSLIQGLLNENTEIVELEVQGKKMKIQDRNLLAAVLQSNLIENISSLGKKYRQREGN